MISSSSKVISWSKLGKLLCSELQIQKDFELFHINSFQAIFYGDYVFSRANLEFQFKAYNVTYSVFRWHHQIWGSAAVNHYDFNIAVFGIPFQFLSLEVIHATVNICGVLLKVDTPTLKLTNLQSMRKKIRNKNGINSIPRVVKIFCGKQMFTAYIQVTGKSSSSTCTTSSHLLRIRNLH